LLFFTRPYRTNYTVTIELLFGKLKRKTETTKRLNDTLDLHSSLCNLIFQMIENPFNNVKIRPPILKNRIPNTCVIGILDRFIHITFCFVL